jgi:CubicO group peptidase (beta-lactamase class C family)
LLLVLFSFLFPFLALFLFPFLFPESSVTRSLILPLALAALSACTRSAATPNGGGSPERAALIARIDSIVLAPINAGKAAGAAVAVVKGSDTVLIKGYGKADLEFDVPMPADAMFEIGSVTKQFTAAALVQLADEGKLSLDDDLTKYFPDFPVKGRKIPLRRLLDHTSGIKGYTEIPEFGRLRTLKAPADTLIRIVSKYPFDFPPGEEEIYNNTAYFMAGLIIEKVSGMSYADYVQKNFFDKVGMSRSRYCSENAIVERRAHGYDAADSGKLVRAAYLDHTWPYAAGSLCSTVGDQVKWNQALHGGRVLSPAAYTELIAPATLNDGTELRYAKGLALVPLAGRRAIWHDGGINGFISLNRYLPDDSLHVIVLWNSTGGDLDVGEAIIEAVLGPAPADSVAFTGNLADYTGTWAGRGRGRGMNVVVAADSGRLTLKQGEGKPEPLIFVGNDTWRNRGMLVRFARAGDRVDRLRMDAGYLSVVLTRSVAAAGN